MELAISTTCSAKVALDGFTLGNVYQGVRTLRKNGVPSTAEITLRAGWGSPATLTATWPAGASGARRSTDWGTDFPTPQSPAPTDAKSGVGVETFLPRVGGEEDLLGLSALKRMRLGRVEGPESEGGQP